MRHRKVLRMKQNVSKLDRQAYDDRNRVMLRQMHQMLDPEDLKLLKEIRKGKRAQP